MFFAVASPICLKAALAKVAVPPVTNAGRSSWDISSKIIDVSISTGASANSPPKAESVPKKPSASPTRCHAFSTVLLNSSDRTSAPKASIFSAIAENELELGSNPSIKFTASLVNPTIPPIPIVVEPTTSTIQLSNPESVASAYALTF